MATQGRAHVIREDAPLPALRTAEVVRKAVARWALYVGMFAATVIGGVAVIVLTIQSK